MNRKKNMGVSLTRRATIEADTNLFVLFFQSSRFLISHDCDDVSCLVCSVDATKLVVMMDVKRLLSRDNDF
jgi:hypothetical protein